MSFEAVRKLESELGRTLPAEYRAFLTSHSKSYLEPQLLVSPLEPIPGSGPEDVVSEIYTAMDMLEDGMLGVPEESMLVIGSIQPGGYLYMCFAAGREGRIYAGFPFQDPNFYLVGASFSQFQSRCRPSHEGDA